MKTSAPLLLALLLAACSGTRSRVGDAGPRGDGGRPRPIDAAAAPHDGGTEPAPPPEPDRLSLRVLEAEAFRGDIDLHVALTNGLAAPVPLDRTHFTLETDAGLVYEAEGAGLVRDYCPSDVSVAPGATFDCLLSFSIPSEELPTRVHYGTPEGDRTTADVPTCGPSRPDGVCEDDLRCIDGTCTHHCSDAHPSGYCAAPSFECLDGDCRVPCSPSAPDGYCPTGYCDQGTCSSDCFRVFTSSACVECLQAGTACPMRTTACDSETTATDCASALGYHNVCSSSARSACGDESCYLEMRGFWECALRECPACAGG